DLIMSRFVTMFHKLAADAETIPPSPSDIFLSSRILSIEYRRSLPLIPSSINQSDSLRMNLLRTKIIQRAHHIMDLDRIFSSSWSLPPLPSFSVDESIGEVKTHSDEAQSIAANNEALDQLFGNIFSSPQQRRPSDEIDANLFCSKQAKIRKMDEWENESHSSHWDSQLFLPVY
ncbi:hypothetical protein PENTCL1PPCAC_26804, partial [Pristionchus entomophagus]